MCVRAYARARARMYTVGMKIYLKIIFGRLFICTIMCTISRERCFYSQNVIAIFFICLFNLCENRYSYEDFEVVVVQIITQVHESECEIITSEREFAKYAGYIKKNRTVSSINEYALAIQLRKRELCMT